jgi:chitin disaccharide deacetylase
MSSPPAGRLLIVSADDYGLTPGVSRAIIDAHLAGVVTSTSVLALGPALERTRAWLDDVPALGLGAHLAAVGEDPPLLSASEIPTLVDRQGRLPASWRQFLPLAAAGRIDPDDLHREFGAQLQRLVDAGVNLDHVDTHQNLHLWPVVRRVVMDLGAVHGIRAIRVTRSDARSPVGATVRGLARRLEQTCDRAGWAYPDASSGLDEAGHLDERSMLQALFRLASTGAGSAELACHPGLGDDPERDRYRWSYQWEDEYEALRSPAVRSAIGELGFRLGSFGDLVPAGVS